MLAVSVQWPFGSRPATGRLCVRDLKEYRFLVGDISNGERNLGQSIGFEQYCTDHRVGTIFFGRVGLHGYA